MVAGPVEQLLPKCNDHHVIASTNYMYSFTKMHVLILQYDA